MVQIGRTQVEAVLGNITDQGDVDAIVNAANENLQLGGGVAGAIRKADDGTVVRACAAYIAENGPVHVGSAVITPGWVGGPQWVVHAVGPIYAESEHDNCCTLLDMAYESVFATAESQGIARLALVLISSGIFGFTANKGSSRIAWEVTQRFLRVHPGAFELIRFVSKESTPEFKAILREFDG